MPLASYRTRALYQSELVFSIRSPVANNLRSALLAGGRRGSAWRIVRVRYDGEPLRLQAHEARAREIHDAVVAMLGASSYIMCFSGAAAEAFVLLKLENAQQTLELRNPPANVAMVELRVQGRLQGAALSQIVAIVPCSSSEIQIKTSMESRD